jgi:hypothetical protein
MKFRFVYILLALCSLYFIAAGILLIPYAGFQHDEVVFAQPVYQRGLAFFAAPLGHRYIPLMITSYAGAFKTWIWWPILKLWYPSVYSIRVPAMLFALVAILMFWPIMVRAGGKRAAAIATILLATDTMYLMTSVFDWGPCALQHFFLVAVMLAFLRYHETPKDWILALASLLCGLALWEKALFFWLGGGLVVAALAIYPKQVWRHVSVRNLGIALAAFLIGASPLILYNLHKPNSTLGENATFSSEEFEGKVENAKRTITAHAIFTYICYDDWKQPPRESRDDIEETSLQLRENTGMSQRNMMAWAYILAIILLPFAWPTRVWKPTLFAWVFCLVGWALMLATKGAGASVHHVILLWPMPLMLLSLPIAEVSRAIPRKIAIPVLTVVVGFFAAENILATNQYLAQFIRNGPTVIWTNALFPLSNDLMHANYREVEGIDWGTIVPLTVLERAQVPLGFVNVDDPQTAQSKMSQEGVVFLSHVKGEEVTPEVNDKLDRIAAKAGYTKHVIKTYTDENTRPVFDLFEYRK